MISRVSSRQLIQRFRPRREAVTSFSESKEIYVLHSCKRSLNHKNSFRWEIIFNARTHWRGKGSHKSSCQYRFEEPRITSVRLWSQEMKFVLPQTNIFIKYTKYIAMQFSAGDTTYIKKALTFHTLLPSSIRRSRTSHMAMNLKFRHVYQIPIAEKVEIIA